MQSSETKMSALPKRQRISPLSMLLFVFVPLSPLLTICLSVHQARVLQAHCAVRRLHHVPWPALSTGARAEAAVPGACSEGGRGQALGQQLQQFLLAGFFRATWCFSTTTRGCQRSPCTVLNKNTAFMACCSVRNQEKGEEKVSNFSFIYCTCLD